MRNGARLRLKTPWMPYGRHRSPRLLLAASRHRGAATDQSGYPGLLAGRGRPTRARPRLSHALSRLVPPQQRALHRLHAGRPGRAEMADRPPGACRPGRSILVAAAGCRVRPYPARACAGDVRRPGKPAARSLACAGALGPPDRRDPQSPRGVDAHRRHAVRARPALFTRADHATVAPDLVHAGRLGRGAVHAAGGQRLVPALGNGVGARRRSAVDAVCRRAYRGGDQAGLSRAAGPSRTRTAYPAVATGAGAVAEHAGTIEAGSAVEGGDGACVVPASLETVE